MQKPIRVNLMSIDRYVTLNVGNQLLSVTLSNL